MQTTKSNTFNIYRGLWRAQSFTPSLANLKYIDVYVKTIGDPADDLVLSIRNDIYGSDVTTASRSAASISESLDWVRFDFSDINVVPGQVYYIVLKSASGSSSECYTWGYSYSNTYPSGTLWYSSNAGGYWWQYTPYDFCFITYGS